MVKKRRRKITSQIYLFRLTSVYELSLYEEESSGSDPDPF